MTFQIKILNTKLEELNQSDLNESFRWFWINGFIKKF